MAYEQKQIAFVSGFFHLAECIWDSIHVVASISSLLLSSIPLYAYATVYLFTTWWHLGYYLFGAIMNKDLHTGFVWVYVFISFE